MAEIQNISIELVKVHPNNVRKTYNDIEELAEHQSEGNTSKFNCCARPTGTWKVFDRNRKQKIDSSTHGGT